VVSAAWAIAANPVTASIVSAKRLIEFVMSILPSVHCLD